MGLPYEHFRKVDLSNFDIRSITDEISSVEELGTIIDTDYFEERPPKRPEDAPLVDHYRIKARARLKINERGYTSMVDIEDLDAIFESMDTSRVVLNDLPARTKEQKAKIIELVCTVYHLGQESIDSRARCNCGDDQALVGNYRIGVFHDRCHSYVKHQYDHRQENRVWIRCPDESGSFINPYFFMKLFNGLQPANCKSWNGLMYLIKTNEKPAPTNVASAVDIQRRLDAFGKRGYRAIVDNFDAFMKFLGVNFSRSITPDLMKVYQRYKDVALCQYMPFPNKMAFIREDTEFGPYSDPYLRNILDATWLVPTMNNDVHHDPAWIQNRTAIVMKYMNEYRTNVLRTFGKKKEWIRKTIMGAPRMNHTFRTVVTSLHGVHRYDECKIPYLLAVSVYREQLSNKLIRQHGFTFKQSYEYISHHMQIRDPLLEKLLYEMIEDSPYPGLPVTLTRYPSLTPLSTTLQWAVGISNKTIEISTNNLRGSNSDFDGDEKTGVTFLSIDDVERMRGFMAHKHMYSASKVGQLNYFSTLPDLSIGVIHRWMHRIQKKNAGCHEVFPAGTFKV